MSLQISNFARLTKLASSIGASLMGFIGLGAGAVATTVQAALREVVSVKRFGAVGDGVTDDTAAIQAALNYAVSISGELKFPAGTYKITDTLLATYTQSLQGLMLSGNGMGSKLVWYGAANKPMIKVVSSAGLGWYAQTTIKNLRLTSSLALGNGVIGMMIGDPSGVQATGVGNVTIDDNCIDAVDYGIQTFYESDEIYINRNHIRNYKMIGIDNHGTAGLRVIQNHIQDGATDSYFISSTRANTTVDDNIMQSAFVVKGVLLSNVASFTVVNNYSESTTLGVNNRFVDVVSSSQGYIANNTVGGMASATAIYNIDAASSNITFGQNRHALSGGTPSKIVNIAVGATNIVIMGAQITDSVAAVMTGTPIFSVERDQFKFNGVSAAYTCPISATSFVSKSGSAVLNQYVAVDLFTMAAGQTYLVTIGDATGSSTVTALVTVPAGGTTVIATNLYATNTLNLNITVSGLIVRALRNIAGNSSGLWSAIRIL